MALTTSNPGISLRFRPPRIQQQSFPAPKLQAPKNKPVVVPKASALASTPATSTEFRPMPAVRGALAFGNIAYPGQRGIPKVKVNKPTALV